MKALIITAALLTSFHSTVANTYEPFLVNAVVRELKLAPNFPPNPKDGNPLVWEAVLVIDKVLRGPEDLKGMQMHTLTATSLPQGNTRVVTPKLMVGDAGIWAIEKVTDGRWFDISVYHFYEVEKGVPLPLIKGRHDAYEKFLSRLSGTPGASLPQGADKGPIAQSIENPKIAQYKVAPKIEDQTFREILRVTGSAATSGRLSDPDDTKPLSQVPPEKLWQMAEVAQIMPEGFPSIAQFGTLMLLLEAIESHPKKSQFVDLMLPKIATTSLPTREPKNWNEILIIGSGGIAGLLISNVTKIAQPTDCQRIVDSILATNEAAKIAKLREAASLVEAKDEFQSLLKTSE